MSWDVEVVRGFSKDIGTHYKVYANKVLIHIEYSRSSADALMQSIRSSNKISDLFVRSNERYKLKYNDALEKIESLEIENCSMRESLHTHKTSNSNVDMIKNEYAELWLMHKYRLSELQSKELLSLILAVSEIGFKKSSDLSNYIVERKLGYEYPNIAGVVTMSSKGDTWSFPGGFPTNIYKAICLELGLSDQGSNARAIAFRSFGNSQE
ncbi:hypothetical protein [Cobetia sp. MC34]|uniref:hypothetical protein n=1 Tax=Cobetia sp. MC34 TaxID=2785080 RepID=UPI001BC8E09E|nr:hypothetical protein [Cobetia sp. MC34]MBS4155370.1 hypothetical protein [Cobetia sp. MC34]